MGGNKGKRYTADRSAKESMTAGGDGRARRKADPAVTIRYTAVSKDDKGGIARSAKANELVEEKYDTVEDYMAVTDAKHELEFRNATRESLTRVAPGDEDKPVDKQRRVPRESSRKPITTCEEFTNALLTALGWLAGDREPGILDMLAAKPNTIEEEHKQRYELAGKLSLFDRACRHLFQAVHDDQPLVQSLLDMCADLDNSLRRYWEWEEVGHSHHDFAYGMISRVHENFAGFQWGPGQEYDTLLAFIDDNWDALVDLVMKAMRPPHKRNPNAFDTVSKLDVRNYVNEVAGEGRRLRVRFRGNYSGDPGAMTIEEWEAKIPQLDLSSPEWLTATRYRELVPTAPDDKSLRSARSRGRKHPNGCFGIDTPTGRGRIWRKETRKARKVYYFRQYLDDLSSESVD